MNWFFWLGLLEYGYEKEAEAIRQGVFELYRLAHIKEQGL
jgi:hypothetical protein